MEREQPRKRRHVSRRGARVLTMLGFRYSYGRDAYVLRIVGHRLGPVLKIRTTENTREPAGATHPELKNG